MRVELVRAWPRSHESRRLELDEGATVADALRTAAWPVDGCGGLAIFGVAGGPDTPLRDGDRVEVLRPLQVDPKQARRLRAERRPLKSGR